MAKTVASQATNGGSIPLARSLEAQADASARPRAIAVGSAVAGYQACGVPQCAQHGDAVTSPVHANPHSHEYRARSSIPLPRRARTWETGRAGRCRGSDARRDWFWDWRLGRRDDLGRVSCMTASVDN